MAPRTLLIPSLLDDWFPLLRHAFASDRWDPVLLTEANPQLAELGLRYFHNELCYPVFLIAGQVLSALGSGRYDPRRCGVLLRHPPAAAGAGSGRVSGGGSSKLECAGY